MGSQSSRLLKRFSFGSHESLKRRYLCQSLRGEDIDACGVSDVYENGEESWMEELFNFI